MSDKPEWVPEDGGEAYASHVMRGVTGGHDGLPARNASQAKTSKPRRALQIEDYVNGVLEGNRAMLARAITLIESNAERHFSSGQEVLRHLLPHTGKSVRVGISGAPGAGKSTFIDALGMHLLEQGHQVAVLAVDPSSSVTRGSILGDKTRMENLSRAENAFIRPSPTGGMLGGVARKSRETMLICEAAGFDVILIETVGTGQSEITVRSMVDFFLLLLITGAGDELQGIKKGIIEIADSLLINKADGDNRARAHGARGEYNRALHYLAPATEGWQTRAYTCSAYTGEGIPEIWTVIQSFMKQTAESGVFEQRRQQQTRQWLHLMVETQLLHQFFEHPEVKSRLPEIETAVLGGTMPATTAAHELLKLLQIG